MSLSSVTRIFVSAKNWLENNDYSMEGKWQQLPCGRFIALVGTHSVATLKVDTKELVIYNPVATVDL